MQQVAAKQKLRSEYRKNNTSSSKAKSRFQYRTYDTDQNGNRYARKLRSGEIKVEADLISTSYYNPSSDTATVHSIALDLDFDRADPKWVTDAKLDEKRILEHLKVEDPELHGSITEVTRSFHGKGLGVAIAISPMELSKSNLAVKKMATNLQEQLVKILKFYGMGADKGARGLDKLMPNFKNPDKLLYQNEVRRKAVDKYGTPVINELLSYSNAHAALKQTKADLTDILHVYGPTEAKLVEFYDYLLTEALESSIQLTFKEIKELTGLSNQTLYSKILKNSLDWVNFEHISKLEGYAVTFYPRQELSGRVSDLLRGYDKYKKFEMGDIYLPEEVIDGERNQWLTNLILSLKHKGLEQWVVKRILSELVDRVPGSEESRTCLNAEKILANIYGNQQFMFGCRPDLKVPEWLENMFVREKKAASPEADEFEARREPNPPEPSTINSPRESTNNYKKPEGRGLVLPPQFALLISDLSGCGGMLNSGTLSEPVCLKKGFKPPSLGG